MERTCRACGQILNLKKDKFSKEGKGLSRSVYYCQTHSTMTKEQKTAMFNRRVN